MSSAFSLARFIVPLAKDQIRLAREEVMGICYFHHEQVLADGISDLVIVCVL